MASSAQRIKTDFLAVSDFRKTLVLILASLLLLAQAVPLIYTRWVEDESFYAAPADSLANHGELRMRQFAPPGALASFDPRPPLGSLLMAGAFKLFGTNLYSAKLPFLLSAVAGVVLTYLLGLELSGSVFLGLIGAVFLATDNMYFLAARTVRPEAMVAAFSVAGVLLFLYSQRRNSIPLAFLSGIVVGTGVLAHPNAFAAATTAGILALVEYRATIIRRARPWTFVAGLLLTLLPFILFGISNPVRRAEFIRTYTEGEGQPMHNIPALELSRYKDFIGISNTRFSLPIPIPYRLHVVVALLAAVYILYRYNRPLLWKLLYLIVPCMLWWAYIRFESVRYTATASPYFALLLAGAVLALWEHKPQWRKPVAALAILLGVVQIASNYGLLFKYRKANYTQLGRQLEAVIPRDAKVYGAFTFWMALNDHVYYSWNRAPLKYALAHGTSYLILNDRVLLHGSGFGKDDWAHVRRIADEFVSSGGATLVAHVNNPFYGDLEIYRVNHPETAGTQSID